MLIKKLRKVTLILLTGISIFVSVVVIISCPEVAWMVVSSLVMWAGFSWGMYFD